MEKEFVPYEQALQLRELGFDEDCLCTYGLLDKEISRNPSCNMIGEPIDEPYTWKNSKIHNSVFTAPLYQQAFSWFREKYNWYGIIAPRYNSDNSLWFVFETINPNVCSIKVLNNELFEGWFEMYETQDKAELACLKRLIEYLQSK